MAPHSSTLPWKIPWAEEPGRLQSMGLRTSLIPWNLIYPTPEHCYGLPGHASGKEPTCQCRRYKRRGSVPGSERRPGVGNGSPLQYSCLENPTDRGAHTLNFQSSVSVVVLCPTLRNPRGFPSKNTGMGCHFLLQGIFLTQGSNSSLSYLLHWQEDPSLLSHQGTTAIHFIMHSLSS